MSKDQTPNEGTLPEDDFIAALYREEQELPPSDLDEAVLAAAMAPVRRRRMAWAGGLATAAVLVLSIGVVLQQAPPRSIEQTSATPSAIAVPTQASSQTSSQTPSESPSATEAQLAESKSHRDSEQDLFDLSAEAGSALAQPESQRDPQSNGLRALQDNPASDQPAARAQRKAPPIEAEAQVTFDGSEERLERAPIAPTPTQALNRRAQTQANHKIESSPTTVDHAAAQEQPAPPRAAAEDVARIEEVIVTGSKIVKRDCRGFEVFGAYKVCESLDRLSVQHQRCSGTYEVEEVIELNPTPKGIEFAIEEGAFRLTCRGVRWRATTIDSVAEP